MILDLNGFSLGLSLQAARHGHWVQLPLSPCGLDGCHGRSDDVKFHLRLERHGHDRVDYHLGFESNLPTRLRLVARVLAQPEEAPFHLIPGNIHGDNNAAYALPGEFPVLAADRPHERNRAPLWEFRADRASHPVSIICTAGGAVGISVAPYSDAPGTAEGFIRNGLLAALPDSCGVSLGYGNDPLTFVEKTYFRAATADLSRGATVTGALFAARGSDRRAAHAIVRKIYGESRDRPRFRKTYRQALGALADTFATVSWSPELSQYTNRRCRVPAETSLVPWRAVVEIGWTGGAMLAYPFLLARHLLPDLALPKAGPHIFDEICAGHNERSGLLNDAALNRFTTNRPDGWNTSEVNGWWSGFLPQTRDNHCAYTNAHAAYYLLTAATREKSWGRDPNPRWVATGLKVLDTARELQRPDGAFGYVFSGQEKRVVDWDGFAGCWFVAAMLRADRLLGQNRYRLSTARALDYYHRPIRDLAAWGSPMDTFKSIDSEGNLAFMRAARLMHELTGESAHLEMLRDAANYEYLWRYGFRARPECPPLKGSAWNSCGGTITSVSNPHIHPMGVVATPDLEYLARATDDNYHQSRADDGMSWLMNTLELYPDVVGYGRYGVLSERTCPSDGLLSETYADTGAPASTWWSYNAWAAGSAMEGIAEQLLAGRREPNAN